MNQHKRKKGLRLLVLETGALMAPGTVPVAENMKPDLHLYFDLDSEKQIWINISNGKLNYINLLEGHS